MGHDVNTVGILCSAASCPAKSLAQEIAEWIAARGRRAWVHETDGREVTADGLAQTDLLLTLGGDGSILRAARAAAPHGVPLLGVNLGRVGFLTESDPTNWQEVLGRVLNGEYWIEERMRLRATAWRDGATLGQAGALNDVVVGRGSRAYVVHLCAEVDGGFLASYVADALIVATPTGSTAYALAAGGPVMPPQLRSILLVPVAPHLSMERPIVLAEGAKVRILVTDDRPAVLTVDGEVHAELESGDEVCVEASTHVSRFARVQEPTYFYRTLVTRLAPRNQFL
ncbi:MAG: NAD(+)/NADH kinase [Chloroflexi bacterium]|nr:NAD(+)/NADH kinase [Chloroflexota bacterium]